MNYIPVLLASIVFISIIIGLVLTVKNLRKKCPEEIGLDPIFEETCGGRFNSLNSTWPFVIHSIYRDIVVIKHISGKYILPRNNLTFEVADGFVSDGIRYKSSKYIGHDIRIWTLDQEEVIKILSDNA